jgi:hypothetical protein
MWIHDVSLWRTTTFVAITCMALEPLAVLVSSLGIGEIMTGAGHTYDLSLFLSLEHQREMWDRCDLT